MIRDVVGEWLFDPVVVDLVSLSADRTTVLLTIVSDEPWTGSDEQTDSLQMKIHNYVGYARDGGLAKTYPETVGLPWTIAIDCRVTAPDPRTAAVLDALVEPLARYGGQLVVRSGPDPA